jgi:hypothetical protein
LTDLLDFVGTFAFALSGAVVGIRRGMDFFGVVLGFVTAVAGGIIRDVLIGSLPPDALQSWHGLALAVLAAALTFLVGGPIARLHWLVRQFDAVGLAMFSVIGANKALDHGLMPVMAAVLGMVTAIGGGIARDIMALRMPPAPPVSHKDNACRRKLEMSPRAREVQMTPSGLRTNRGQNGIAAKRLMRVRGSRAEVGLLIDSIVMTLLPGPRNPKECHFYLAEGCHLYIAATVACRIRRHYGKRRGVARATDTARDP